MSFQGSSKIQIDDAGDLVLEVACVEIRQMRPLIYQEVPSRAARVQPHGLAFDRRSASLAPEPSLRCFRCSSARAAGVKVLISIGGSYPAHEAAFSTAARDDALRRTFAATCTTSFVTNC
jgi:GH18 family chitinase